MVKTLLYLYIYFFNTCRDNSTVNDLHDRGLLKTGNILNFNVGATVDLDIPRSFWSRLAGKYGNIFYWKEKVE